jgi:thiol-disulfide isomerase/thioredoxin
MTRRPSPRLLRRDRPPTPGRRPPPAVPVLALVTALAVLALAGCDGGDDGSAAGTRADQREEPAVTPTGTPGKAAAAAPGLPPCPAGSDLPAVAGGLPRQTLNCLGAGPRVTLSGLRGRPMVVNVWASWCPPCAKEMPLLVAARKAAGDRVAFLGIDIQNTREQGVAWATDASMNFPSVLDEDGEVKAPLRLLGPPVTYFVRADGRIAHVHTGELRSGAQLSGLIRDHLGVRL